LAGFKARKLFRVLERLGWRIKDDKGSSHKQMIHPTHGEATWCFHESEEIGPKMMARVAKAFHFTRDDL
jgi:predicted RNA binding protein YcfA (HicA-like mRNA interferase family)